jgi:hypothetical protein
MTRRGSKFSFVLSLVVLSLVLILVLVLVSLMGLFYRFVVFPNDIGFINVINFSLGNKCISYCNDNWD